MKINISVYEKLYTFKTINNVTTLPSHKEGIFLKFHCSANAFLPTFFYSMAGW